MMALIRKVSFVCHGDWVGGPVSFLRRTSAELVHHGWQPTLLLTGRKISPAYDIAHWPSPVVRLGSSYSWPALGERVAKAVVQSEADIVVGMPTTAAKLAIYHLLKSGRSSVRFLDTVHLDVDYEYQRIRENAPLLAGVACVSDSIVHKLENEVGELRGRIHRFYCPVPSATASPQRRQSSGSIRMIYVGQIANERKRVFDLADLARELHALKCDFRMTIVGDGPDAATLAERVRGLGDIRLTGLLDSDAVMHEIAASDILLLMSDQEGQPFVVMEAMGQGVVPVVTELPGLTELLTHNETGCLLPVGNINAFVRTVAELSQDRDRLCRMSNAGWELINAKYATPRSVAHFASVLEKAMEMPLPVMGNLPVRPFPPSWMDAHGIPESLQALKRWSAGQEVY